ncbi:hypothetical protein Nepgr_027360 [Nepenthes gracilis]|uniref:Uncharacterized protein n=1 Tax=Nepenthes gracilis TaxID=150966 RepID=A0AAD3TBL4_NEPGR|nr:hypothetical protein Nepgr_027360 [Nepenthes gracilis]
MLSTSPSTIVRSSLEEMLDNIRRRDEKPKDLPPALPSRPNSKARQPPGRRSLPVSIRVSEDSCDGKAEVKRKSEGCREAGELSIRGNSFGKKIKSDQLGESPYVSNSEKTLNEERSGVAAVTSTARSVAEWDDYIGYFIKKKLRVWCRLPTGQWEMGQIQSTSGEESRVQLSNGNVVKVSMTELLPANPEILVGVDNLIQLSYLNEPSVLYNLQYRYSHDKIYSKAGPVLIAINPFKNLQIYGNNYITAYRKKLVDSPHVFAAADAAYNEMIRDGVNQSVILSGESGAGKTETAKLAMQYLAALGGSVGGIEHEVLQTSCILEAFGNAKTSRNNNSSRFGKLIDIHFSMVGKICGASIQTSLLEKSRVVQLAKGERSYHVFYQLCAGAPSVLRGKLNIKMANEYHYLNQSNCLAIDDVDDAQLFYELMKALDIVRICKEDQESIFAMLAVVLWLGNMSFQVIDAEGHVEVLEDEAIATASRLMGCSAQDLMLLTLQQAIDTRDALAKFIYARLFDWLVEKINKSLEVGKQWNGRSISILDIYGFESFQENSFEQFCINYANERLLQHFIRHLLKLEQEDYEADGIDWTKVHFEDNQECLNLFEKKPLGLLSLLDEESNFPKSTDLSFANKLKQHLNSNPFFKEGRDGTFSVRHFAGEVLYDTNGFLEKNRDPLCYESIYLLSCSCPLLQLFATNVVQSQDSFGNVGQSGVLNVQRQSVGAKLKGQLYKLMQRLESTMPHFIHCIKPNTKQLPDIYEKDLVLHQLRCCGVLEVIKIARSGYPIRITHQEFAQRYGFLVLDKTVSQDPLSISIAVLQQFKIMLEMYRVGYTKLYFRTGQIGEFENTRKRVLQSIVGVQRLFRGYKARSQFCKLKRTVATLQAFVRAENARRKWVSLSKNDVVDSQKQMHKRGASETLDEKQRAIIQLQSVIRGCLTRKHLYSIQNLGNRCVRSNWQQGSNISEVKDLCKEHNEVPSSVLLELQKRISKADATLAQKEEENEALRAHLQQYDKRWSEYEAKMRSMEDMWQKQIMSLQLSLAAANRSLASENITGCPGRSDASPSPRYESDDNLSVGSRTPGGITPLKLFNPVPDIGEGRQPNGGLNEVNHLIKEFEQQREVFDRDAKALVDVKSGPLAPAMNANEELRRLKFRFELWKRDYKVRLRETKVMIHKMGNPDSRRKWWGKLTIKIT